MDSKPKLNRKSKKKANNMPRSAAYFALKLSKAEALRGNKAEALCLILKFRRIFFLILLGDDGRIFFEGQIFLHRRF